MSEELRELLTEIKRYFEQNKRVRIIAIKAEEKILTKLTQMGV